MKSRVVLAALAATALCGVASPTAALMSLKPGDAPPAFSLPDLSGATVSQESLAGSPAVLLFWSTWSPRSAEALDDLAKYQAAYAARGLKILAVNIDGENLSAAQRQAVRDYAAGRRLPFPVLLDERFAAFAAFGIMAHPTEVVLDKGGRIAYVLGGYPLSLREELKGAIEQVLGIAPAVPPPALPAVGYVPKGGALMHYNLGRQMLARGEPGRALEAFRRASAADPDFLEPALMAARLQLIEGNLEEAERFARQAGPEAVNRGDLGLLLGHLSLRKGDLASAEKAFQALRESLPREGWGAWGLGLVALARGDRAAALALMQQAQALSPEGNLEAEAAVKQHFRALWLRRESAPEEEGFVKLFPGLADLRDRYRRLYGG